jgi:hypothetical protein
MTIAIWIIAICEVIRAIQNIVPIVVQVKNSKSQENAYSEFIKSLKKSDKEFMADMIQEWKRQEEEDGKDTGHGKND